MIGLWIKKWKLRQKCVWVCWSNFGAGGWHTAVRVIFRWYAAAGGGCDEGRFSFSLKSKITGNPGTKQRVFRETAKPKVSRTYARKVSPACCLLVRGCGAPCLLPRQPSDPATRVHYCGSSTAQPTRTHFPNLHSTFSEIFTNHTTVT